MKIKNNPHIEELMHGFESKNLSDVTQKRWRYIAEDFLAFLERKGIQFSKDDTSDTSAVRDYLVFKKRGMSGNGMRTIYYALKSMYKIWGKKWDLEDVPHGREPERPFFSIDETKKIIETAKRRYKERGDFYGLRDLVMIFVSVDTGSRRIQLQRLNRENFTKEKTLNIPPAFKGGSWTNRKLRNETVQFIEEYLEERRKRLGDYADEAESPLFIDKENKRISPEAMGWVFGEIKREANVNKPGGAYHGMRRSKTTRLHAGGMSEVEIVKVMGWKEGSKEVHIYTQLDQRKIQEKAYDADELMSEEKER